LIFRHNLIIKFLVYNNLFLELIIKINNIMNTFIKWGLGIGDWGLGIGGWGQNPKPKNPNPKPQTPK
jgi:hypothetical protein